MEYLLLHRAVIFDLDGTLADSMDVWDKVLPLWLQRQGLALSPGLMEEITTMTLEESAALVAERFGLEAVPAEIMGQWSDIVAELYENEVKPKPGAVELLRALAEQGVPLGLATSSFPRACQGVLRRWGVWELFQVVVYTHETGRGKSYPDVYLACARELGVPPEECVVLEDILAALEGVRAAGMSFVAVFDPAERRWDELRQKADMAVLSLEELL